jgi:secreted PhoX family phosphatase
MLTRRRFLRQAGWGAVGLIGLRTLVNQPLFSAVGVGPAGYGPLVEVSGGLIRLPRGFQAVRFSSTGEEMADGLLVPGRHDGMAAFAGPGGLTLLVRNHELASGAVEFGAFGRNHERLARIDQSRIYDLGLKHNPSLGGTTTVVFDTRTQRLQSHHLSLGGTVLNCAGGPTPWGTWVTCEEIKELPEPDAGQVHGFNFEVTPSVEPNLNRAVPLKAMGRFRHEAIAVDPASGAVYETEDVGDGLLYRFLPHEPGRLAAGGRLQALALADWPTADTRNWPGTPEFPVGRKLKVKWIDLEEVESPAGDLRKRGAAAGAAVFARGEGAWTGGDGVYFAMTNGGRKLLGQIFRYVPGPYEGTAREAESPGTLELFAQPDDSALLTNCDNLTIAPWGDVVICEDNGGHCRVVGVTPAGEFYVIASLLEAGRELAGACFSPDGTTLFVNVQTPGYTLAITGPWEKRGRV